MSNQVEAIATPTIALADIREDPDAFRTVDKTSLKYTQLVDSIREWGVLQPILVRVVTELPDPHYVVVAGLHRVAAAREIGLTQIPARTIEVQGMDTLAIQMVENLQRIEAKPAEYTRGLLLLMQRFPELSAPQIAKKLGQSSTFIQQRLRLSHLSEKLLQLVDDGVIPLNNAYALSSLPAEEQENWTERAATEPVHQFVPQVQARVRELKAKPEQKASQKAVQKRIARAEEFQPTPHFQKVLDARSELENSQIGPALVREELPEGYDEESARWGFNLGVQWCLHMDPKSVEAQVAKHRQEVLAAEVKKEKLKRERDALKAAKLVQVEAA